jgi:YD repeat-containing protein
MIAHPETKTWQLTALQTIGLPADDTGNSLTAANPTGTVIDERTQTWSFSADRFGQTTEWTNPLGHQTVIARQGDGLPAKVTVADPDGTGPLTVDRNAEGVPPSNECISHHVYAGL